MNMIEIATALDRLMFQLDSPAKNVAGCHITERGTPQVAGQASHFTLEFSAELPSLGHYAVS